MVHLHTVGGNARTSYGVYLNKGQIERAGWSNGDSLRITVVDDDFVLVTPEHMPTQQWVELYDSATAKKTVDEMTPVELIMLVDASEGDDGRRASSVTSLAPLGESGHRILVTNAVNRLQLSAGTDILRRVNLDVVILVPADRETESVKERIRTVLDVRESQTG